MVFEFMYLFLQSLSQSLSTRSMLLLDFKGFFILQVYIIVTIIIIIIIFIIELF